MVTDNPPPPFVLASQSPARRKLLQAAGIDPVVLVSEVDEEAVAAALPVATSAADTVIALAQAKASEVLSRLAHPAIVVGCDSMLLFDGELTGKPHTPAVARAQWQRLRGHSAQLLTGHAVTARTAHGTVSRAECISTTIHFAAISDAEIDAYVATGEPLEVAGAFTLDGRGGWFIDGIDGDPSSVLGLSLPLVRRLLHELGFPVAELWN